MNYLKKITVFAISALLLFAGPFFSAAQDYETWVMDNWSKDKEEAFKQAKEQDKFVLLFVGRPTCPTCRAMSELFCNPDNPFLQIFEDNFVTLYKCYDEEDDRADVFEYIEEYYYEREILGLVRQIPWLYIINPDREGESVISMYRPYPEWRPDEETMLKFLAIDLLDANELNWYAEEDKVFELASEQEKLIFKFVGSGTSPNSQKVMDLLQEAPLKQILDDNFILWYVNNDDDCGCDIILTSDVVSKDMEIITASLPYISIFDPNYPEDLLEDIWGVQDGETLEEILLKYAVANEKIPTINNVYVSGNLLIISNQIMNEQIKIYSLTGQGIASVSKNDFTISIDIAHLPKGIFVINSSAGWSAKIVKQ